MFVEPSELLHDNRSGREMTFEQWAKLGAQVGEAYHDPHPIRFGRQLVLDYIRSGVLSFVAPAVELDGLSATPLFL